MILAILTLTACADGFPAGDEVDGKPVEATVTDPASPGVDDAAPVDVTPDPVEAIPGEIVTDPDTGEALAGVSIPPGSVVVDGVLLADRHEVVYHLPPNGGPSFVDKWAAEFLGFLGFLWAFYKRRKDVPALMGAIASLSGEAVLRSELDAERATNASLRREMDRLRVKADTAPRPSPAPPVEPVRQPLPGAPDFRAEGIRSRLGR